MSAPELSAEERAVVERFDAADPAPESFRERAAEALFVARGYDRRFWPEGGTPHTVGIRRDCRYLIDHVFDEVIS